MPSKKKLRKRIHRLEQERNYLKFRSLFWHGQYLKVWEERRQMAERLGEYEPMGLLPHIRLGPMDE